MAFGLLFAAVAVLAPRAADHRAARLSLLSGWVVCWLPHVVIGIAFAVGGSDPRSVSDYRAWGATPVGASIIAADALLLLLHVGLSALGFVLAGRAAWRVRA